MSVFRTDIPAPAAPPAAPPADGFVATAPGAPATEDPSTEMVQLLSPEGERLPHPELDPLLDDVGPEQLRQLYREMVTIRAADDQATSLQRQGQLGLWAPAVGQEGAQIGAGHAPRPQDYVAPTYREHGLAYARGIDPARLLELYRGISHGGWNPRELMLHPYALVLAAQVPQAVGYAMGIQLDGDCGTGDPEHDAAVLAFFGEGASSEGDVSESFTFAASTGAPIVFFAQNNQWAISVPFSVQSRVPLALRSRGWGIPSARIDGNDALASLAATRMALDRARAGEGPFFIEAVTYRSGPHTTSDDPTRYRTSDEEARWAERDPILRLRRHLEHEDLADQAFFDEVETEGHDLAMDLHRKITAMEDPDGLEMFDQVYAEPHPLIDEERAAYTAYRDSFADTEPTADRTEPTADRADDTTGAQDR